MRKLQTIKCWDEIHDIYHLMEILNYFFSTLNSHVIIYLWKSSKLDKP